MRPSVRDIYQRTGYTYATRAEEIASRAGYERIARLASNENPFPLSSEANRMACEALKEANRYPPELHTHLIGVLAETLRWPHVVLGNGMDGVIETVIRTLVNPGEGVVIAEPTFSFYRIAATAQAGAVKGIPRKADFSVDISGFIDCCQGAKLAFLCTPNNPTANFTPPEDVREILDATDVVLFLDNAYIEFADRDYRELMADYERLIIGRTMSKAYSMAGLRLGYALVPGWFEPFYHRASTPFSVNRVTAAAAIGALQDPDHVRQIQAHVQRWRTQFLEAIPYPTFPSQANFVLIDTSPLRGEEMMERLAERGILVRSCESFPSLGDHYIRVNIGADWENERFLNTIAAL
jgi:histidinol-phosphate aminotransferase